AFRRKYVGFTLQVGIIATPATSLAGTGYKPTRLERKRIMKSFLLATVGLVALVGMAAPASAADMAVKAPPPAPLPVIYNWSGFYIGGNGGWGQSRNCWDFLDAAGVAFASGCRERAGGLIGGQVGYS